MTDLVSADDIADFPGAPFAADVLTAAGEAVRNICGWTIAPPVTGDVVTLDSDGGDTLYLPSLKVTALTQVRDVSGTTPVVLTGVKFTTGGRLYLQSGFPCGVQAVEVTFTHGYTACPAEILPVVAEIARSSGSSSTVRQQSLGSASITYKESFAAASGSSFPVLDRYRITEV